MGDQRIGEIELHGSGKLIFSVSVWKGRRFADVRKFITTQKYEGPTKAGLTMNTKILREVISALAELERSLPSKAEQEFKRIPKSDTEYIKITTLPPEDSESLPTLDVREFVASPAYQGPTKRGIRVRWNVLPDVIACLQEQAKVIDEGERNEPSLFGIGALAESKAATGQAQGGLIELLGEEVKHFPAAFLEGGLIKGTQIKIPEFPLRLEQDNAGNYHLETDDGVFCTVRNPVEGNFIIYAQMQGHTSITVPHSMIHLFRSVKEYENYVRVVQAKLIARVFKKVGQRSVAEYEVRKKMGEVGLPWLPSE